MPMFIKPHNTTALHNIICQYSFDFNVGRRQWQIQFYQKISTINHFKIGSH